MDRGVPLETYTTAQIGRKALAATVAVIWGETLARSATTPAAHRHGLPSPTNTLSFALLRSSLLGTGYPDEEIRRRWGYSRAILHAPNDSKFDDCVVAVCASLRAFYSMKPTSDADFETVPVMEKGAADASLDWQKLARKVADLVSVDDPDLFSAPASQSFEERVKRADAIFPRIMKSSRAPRDRGVAAAFLARTSGSSFAHQLLLLEPHLAEVPEAAMWLGVMQLETSLPSVLGIGDGVGWKIAAELQNSTQLLSSPTCDTSFDELRENSRGGPPAILSSTDGRVIVELVSGVNTTIVLAAARSRRAEKMEKSARSKVWKSSEADDALAVAQESLEKAMSALKEMSKKR